MAHFMTKERQQRNPQKKYWGKEQKTRENNIQLQIKNLSHYEKNCDLRKRWYW